MVSLPLKVAALQSNVGYEGEVNISRDFIGGAYGTCIYYGNVTVSFSPFLYPISHMIGNSFISRPFMKTHHSVRLASSTGSHYYENETAQNIGRVPSISDGEKDVMFEVAFSEFLKNLPYYLGVALTVVLVLEAIRQKRREQSECVRIKNDIVD